MTADITPPAPSRMMQHCYPWVVIGVAFVTVAMAFGARNAFAVFLIAPVSPRASKPVKQRQPLGISWFGIQN